MQTNTVLHKVARDGTEILSSELDAGLDNR